VPGTRLDRLADGLASGATLRRRIQKTDMLIPGHVNEHLQLIVGGQIKQPFLRHGVSPDEIGAQ